MVTISLYLGSLCESYHESGTLAVHQWKAAGEQWTACLESVLCTPFMKPSVGADIYKT